VAAFVDTWLGDINPPDVHLLWRVYGQQHTLKKAATRYGVSSAQVRETLANALALTASQGSRAAFLAGVTPGRPHLFTVSRTRSTLLPDATPDELTRLALRLNGLTPVPARTPRTRTAQARAMNGQATPASSAVTGSAVTGLQTGPGETLLTPLPGHATPGMTAPRGAEGAVCWLSLPDANRLAGTLAEHLAERPGWADPEHLGRHLNVRANDLRLSAAADPRFWTTRSGHLGLRAWPVITWVRLTAQELQRQGVPAWSAKDLAAALAVVFPARFKTLKPSALAAVLATPERPVRGPRFVRVEHTPLWTFGPEERGAGHWSAGFRDALPATRDPFHQAYRPVIDAVMARLHTQGPATTTHLLPLALSSELGRGGVQFDAHSLEALLHDWPGCEQTTDEAGVVHWKVHRQTP